MGIHGLTGFIDNNQHLLHEHQLHDCSVVLDGNNFYHFLYYACHVQCSFGGDYDIYRKKIISTFKSFKKCGITPYVVMDGAYTVDGRKLKTSLSRASARIRLVDVMANNQRGQALPALAYETFMQTLNELGVRHATCQFEADNEIAVLANKMQCPVISNDSDFYIFDLSCGFLPLDYLDFRPLEKHTSDGTTTFRYLHCHKYHVDDFINSFDGLNRSVLPIFASLLGNDFINASAFSTFYSRVKVPKIVSKKFSLPPRLSKVISVLHWLHTQIDSTEFSDIKNELLEFINPKRKELVEKMFVSSVNGYVDVDNFQGFDLFHFLTTDPEHCQLTAAADFRGYNGKVFPDWFIKAVCCGEITPSTLNCAILHRVIILTQVEDLSQASSFLCSLGLRRIMYGILLQDDCPHINYSSQHEGSDKSSCDCLSLDSNLSNEKSSMLNCEFSQSQKNFHESSLSDVSRPEGVNTVVRSDEGDSVKVSNSDIAGEEDDKLSDENDSEVEVCENGAMVKGLHAEDGQKKAKQSCVEEYTRINKNLLKNLVEPLYCIGQVPVPSLTDLTTVLLDSRKSILTKSLGVDSVFMNKFSEDLQLFAACLVMWSRNANPKIASGHLETVIVGVILLRALASLTERKGEPEGKVIGDCLEGKELGGTAGCGQTKKGGELTESGSGREKLKKKGEGDKSERKYAQNKKDDDELTTRKDEQAEEEISDLNTVSCLIGDSNSITLDSRTSMDNLEETPIKSESDCIDSEINIDKICSEVGIHDLENIRQSLSKYHTKSPSFNHNNRYNPRVCHAFAQLQACMVDTVNLNKLLRFPFPNICPADLINGTFLYNFQEELATRIKPDLFLAAMLGRNSGLMSTFELFRNVIIEYVGAGYFLLPASLTKKSRKRKSKGKEKQVLICESKVENIDDGETTVKTVSGFNVANMFSVLSMEDNG